MAATAYYQFAYDWVATPGEAELKQMTAFYQETTALRKSSPLFTLGDGATVMKRVDFRNTGADQQRRVCW